MAINDIVISSPLRIALVEHRHLEVAAIDKYKKMDSVEKCAVLSELVRRGDTRYGLLDTGTLIDAASKLLDECMDADRIASDIEHAMARRDSRKDEKDRSR